MAGSGLRKESAMDDVCVPSGLIRPRGSTVGSDAGKRSIRRAPKATVTAPQCV